MDTVIANRRPELEGNLPPLLMVLMELISEVPAPRTTPVDNPVTEARRTVASAARKTALVSGLAGLVPGPLGMLSIIPDMLAVWRIQRQMVADVAGLFGRAPALGPETMIASLFKHSAAHAVRDLVVRTGQKWIVRKASVKALRAVLEKVSVRLAQRIAGRAMSRWLPFVGAAAVGAYAAYDTHQVGETAIELFGREVAIEGAA